MIALPEPDLQIDFSARLATLRTTLLQQALYETVKTVSVPALDTELALFVPSASLTVLASHGLRGELVFPTPIILSATPKLLGYYRLLYGYSQKEFYQRATGCGSFNSMEERGSLSLRQRTILPELCTGLCQSGVLLLAGIGSAHIDASLLDDLTLLTLGPQLRGGANVRKGTAGIRTVFNAIHEIVAKAIVSSSDTEIQIVNAAGRRVIIMFAPDPDIVIREEMPDSQFRDIIAIEVKAGSDFSNIHNRIGEAEKSHQKARSAGFVECWTVVNVRNLDHDLARRESPSTNRFYQIADLSLAAGASYQDFKNRVILLTGIPSPSV
jgi:XcyI restriction endonuclease